MEILANLSNTIFDPVFNGCGFNDDSDTVIFKNDPSEDYVYKRGVLADLIPHSAGASSLERHRKAGFSPNVTLTRCAGNCLQVLCAIRDALKNYGPGNDDSYQALTGGTSTAFLAQGCFSDEFGDLRKAVNRTASFLPVMEDVCKEIEQLYKERFSGGIPAYHGATDLDDQVAREYGD